VTIEEQLAEIKSLIVLLVERQQVREWYTTEQAATFLGKGVYTVREWCRRHRVNATKTASGRGGFKSWALSHTELLRIQREGLLPGRRSGAGSLSLLKSEGEGL
jgi:hypothetical protein